jgi:hypothetical protein
MEEARMGKERKNRPGLDIAFSLPKGRSVKAYYAAEPDVDAEHSRQWGGKGAILLGASGDAVAKTMEPIEAGVMTHIRQCGERSGLVKGQQVWMEVTHCTQPSLPQKPPKTTLWVNGVKMTPKLWKRLHAMSEDEYAAFWDEQLKGLQWNAGGTLPAA